MKPTKSLGLYVTIDVGVEMGRQDDAQEAVKDALEINPKLSISAMRRQFAGSKNHPENRRIWLASLQKAGVPE